jgi:hypothetical protein
MAALDPEVGEEARAPVGQLARVRDLEHLPLEEVRRERHVLHRDAERRMRSASIAS